MLRHVVLINWNENATPAAQHTFAGELRKLPGVIDSIRLYHAGPDAGINPGNADFAIVADFDDADGYRAYRDHSAHRAVIEHYLNPIVARRTAVQYEI